MTNRRPLAIGVAAVLGLGALFTANPAFAQSPEAATPPPQDAIAEAAVAVAEIQAATSTPESALGYGVTPAGESIVLVNSEFRDDPGFAAAAPGLGVDEIAFISAASTDAATDVVGGAGYFADLGNGDASLCSIGFSAWSPTGDPALITAGHCSKDGSITDVSLSKPSLDAAHTGQPGNIDSNGTGILGRFGMSQHGGPGNTQGEEDNPSSTDIGVIDVVPGFALRPAVTDWTTAGNDDLAASATAIKSVGEPKSGTVSKSGRTTGVTSGSTKVNLESITGTIQEYEILDGYMQVSNRWVHGFIGQATTNPGDSGGAVYQGEQAVGVVSGSPVAVEPGEDDWSWYTRLVNALDFTGGYTVSLDIDVPTVTSPAAGSTVEPGASITVAVPDNATELEVTAADGTVSSVQAVNGAASFVSPNTDGQYKYTLVATNGFSRSIGIALEVQVKESIAAPVITEQQLDAAEGDRSVVTDITGTGIAGASVTVTGIAGERTANATVNEDGTWRIADQTVEIGEHVLSATQTVAADGSTDGAILGESGQAAQRTTEPTAGETSPAASGTITVAPAAPRITSITPDQAFASDQAPDSVAGTGLSGATLTITVNDSAVPFPTGDDTVDPAGAWRAPLGDTSADASYSVAVVQTLNGVTSRTSATVTFTVASPVVIPEPGNPDVNGTQPMVDPAKANLSGGLPVTGGEALLPYVFAAIALALLGAGAVALTARRLKE